MRRENQKGAQYSSTNQAKLVRTLPPRYKLQGDIMQDKTGSNKDAG
jgi:hypothetical protein